MYIVFYVLQKSSQLIIVESVITLKKALKIEKMKTKKELVFLKNLEIFDEIILKD